MKQMLERLLVHAVSWPPLSRPAGWLADARLPGWLLRALIRAFVRAYRVDLSEAEKPVGSFPTFNAFFTRRLRDGARPIASGPGLVVSPSDSRLATYGRIPEDGRLEQIKGRTYGLAELLGSEEEAATFKGGVQATLYLSPAMYHRVHAPAEGRVVSWRYVPGRLFPVNTLAVRHVERLFARNERVVVRLDTDIGPLAVVLVGAANVGRITLSFADLTTNTGAAARHVQLAEPVALQRGAELGVFNLGSTVVLLAADGALAPRGPAEGALVRVGQPLWARA